MEIFSVTTIPVRMFLDISTLSSYRYESMTIYDGNATVNEDLTTMAQRMLTVLVRFDTVLV